MLGPNFNEKISFSILKKFKVLKILTGYLINNYELFVFMRLSTKKYDRYDNIWYCKKYCLLGSNALQININ